jgi:hypothetical protein
MLDIAAIGLIFLPQKNAQTAAALTSTLLKHHVAPKLESILDKEAKITHDAFGAQIEARLGSGEGSAAKGPDMKVWGKGKGLNDVRTFESRCYHAPSHCFPLCRLIGNWLNSAILQSLFRVQARQVMISDTPSNPAMTP